MWAKKNISDLNPCNVFICSFPGDALNTFIVHTDSVCAVGICIAPNTRDKSRSIEVIFYTISVCIHGAYTHNWFGSFFIVVRCTQIQFALHSLIFFFSFSVSVHSSFIINSKTAFDCVCANDGANIYQHKTHQRSQWMKTTSSGIFEWSNGIEWIGFSSCASLLQANNFKCKHILISSEFVMISRLYSFYLACWTNFIWWLLWRHSANKDSNLFSFSFSFAARTNFQFIFNWL